MAQTGQTFSLTTDSGPHGGNVSGATYFVSWVEGDATAIRENWVEFTLTSALDGTGTLRWRTVDSLGAVVTGGATLTLTRQP